MSKNGKIPEEDNITPEHLKYGKKTISNQLK